MTFGKANSWPHCGRHGAPTKPRWKPRWNNYSTNTSWCKSKFYMQNLWCLTPHTHQTGWKQKTLGPNGDSPAQKNHKTSLFKAIHDLQAKLVVNHLPCVRPQTYGFVLSQSHNPLSDMKNEAKHQRDKLSVCGWVCFALVLIMIKYVEPVSAGSPFQKIQETLTCS